MRTKLLMLLISLMSMAFYSSCTKDDDELSGDGNDSSERWNLDTYQENKRGFHNDSVSVRFSEEVKMFSEYQIHQLKKIENDTILFFSKDLVANQVMNEGDIYVLNESTEAFPFGFVGRVAKVTNDGNYYRVTTTFVPMDSVFSELRFTTISDISKCILYDESGQPLDVEYVTEEYVDSLYEYASSEDEIDDADGNAPQRRMPAQTQTEIKYFKTFTRKMNFVSLPWFQSSGTITIGGGVSVEVDLLNEYASLKPQIKINLNAKFDVKAEKKIGFDDTKKKVGKIYVSPVPNMPIITVPISFYTYSTIDANVKATGEIEVGFSPSCTVGLRNNKLFGKASLGLKKDRPILSNVSISGELDMGMGVRSYFGFGLAKWEVKRWEGSYLDAHADAKASAKAELFDSSDEFIEWANKGYNVLKDFNIEFSGEGGLYFEKQGFLALFGKRITSGHNSDNRITKKTLKIKLATVYILPIVSAWSKQVGEDYADVKYVLSRVLLLPVGYGMALYKGDEKLDTKYAQDNYWFTRVEKTFNFSSLDKGDYKVYPVFKLLGLEIKCPDGYPFTITGKEDDPEDPEDPNDPNDPHDPYGYLSCPDNHHPHAIDLGLPSGTKWACCNVGASKPEEYGGYYAWGETEEKDYYDWSTYTHCDGSSSTCHHIGYDIAGTQYDVAHVKWGDKWTMPSESQMLELSYHVGEAWSTQNGVNGLYLLGSSGYSIFLPTAGRQVEDKLHNEGSYGYFWASTVSNYSNGVDGFYIYWQNWWILWNPSSFRYYGNSVRPVYNEGY